MRHLRLRKLACGVIGAALLAVSILPSTVAQAGSLPGERDPALLAAVETWLADDDAESLPALAALARDGNMAARMLLARIEVTDFAFGDFVAALSREQRHDLFRPGTGKSRFRVSWTRAESDLGNPFAAVLQSSQRTGIQIEAIEALLALGETEATYHLVRKVAVDGSQAERARLLEVIAPDSENAPYLRAFHDTEEGTTTGRAALLHMMAQLDGVAATSLALGDDAEAAAAAQYADYGFQAGTDPLTYDAGNRYFGPVAAWVMSAPETFPLARLCRRACSEAEIPACANLSFGLIGGYYEAIRFDSPLEAVIAQSRFLESERALGMARRRIANARTEIDEAVFSDQELRRRSACLAEAVLSSPSGTK